MRAWIAALIVTLAHAPVQAGPLGEALAKADLTGLRAQLSDPAARCTLGAVYAKKQDLSRAALYLADCGELTLPEDVSAEVARAARDVQKKLGQSELSLLQVVTRPAGLVAELDALPGEQLTTPTSVWVKAGTYTVRATLAGKVFTNTVTIAAYTRGAVYLDLEVAAAPAKPPRDGKVDFRDDNALEKTDGPPPDVKRRSMMSDKQLGIAGPRTGPELADPLAGPAPAAPLPIWLGVRLGGGIFDDGAVAARMRPSVGAAARYALGGPAFLAARIDWTRRGGEGDAAVDVLGASAGAGYSVIDADAIGVALIGQLRGDLRFADTRNAMAVNRAGASAAASLEVAFPTTPLTAGVRFEQGLTELVPGYRDRAVLVELGVDWR
ncbi:MAG: hypothetical protein IPQ07_39195 [Myxococcales bacterium]|nr:hypothetical protein [Myxococcales bacterium]